MEIKIAADGFPVEQGEYNVGLMRMVEDMFAMASPEIRSKMWSQIETRMSNHDRWMGCHKNYVDWSRAADVGDFCEGWGPNYLYVWVNQFGIPFYAGQAEDRDRVQRFSGSTRSEAFQDMIRAGGCHAVVVAKHIPDSKINDLERELIAYLMWEEYPIVNNRDLPSPMECVMAKQLAKSGGSTLKQVFLSHTAHKKEFTKIFAVLNEIVGAVWTGGCAVLSV